ncbi:hypothetical protein ACTWP5_31935 [Streptomyces sp. 4N509B]|uniref:hypothetical protein n=1 Tax=Streptomyces sp. 4N509B TaxID=3457413 RepID=UPI003FD4213B
MVDDGDDDDGGDDTGDNAADAAGEAASEEANAAGRGEGSAEGSAGARPEGRPEASERPDTGFTEENHPEPETRAELATLKEATSVYNDVAAAEAAGYTKATECVPGGGVHYVKSVALNQDELVPGEPSALIYRPTENGELKLAGIEYASETAAVLHGQAFNPPTEGVPYYTLHVWLWEKNLHGLYSPENWRITCEV